MAIKLDTFSSAGGGAGTDNLDDVTSRGATTTNAITVGGVTVGTEYTLPSADGSINQYLKTDGAGNLSFADLDITGGLTYQGAFNATAGTPDISNAEKGDFYVIDTAGTIYGQTWAVGDHLLVNEDMGGTITNSKIDKIDNTDQVTSVNGNTGAVVLSGDDLAADHTAVNYTATNANIDGHLSGIDTAIGASLSPTLDDVTTNGNTTTNTIEVGQVTVSGDILASSADTRTIGAEGTRFITYYGDMNGAIRFKAKNNQGSAITKGQVVYISGVSGTVPEVKLAKADSALTMPAFGVAFANANDQAEVQIVTFGNLTDYNTTTYSLSANDTIYVSATTAGALTNTAPTGESNLIQNIGRVVRADASAGIIKVGGAGRSNATPNLNDGKIFLGNASNQAVSTALSSINLTSFNDDLTYPVTSVNTLTGAVVVSGNDVAADHTAVNYTATNANIDGHLSGVDTKLGTLLADITGESLNDLSDVSFTAGPGIDNYVLTYDNGTSSWGAEIVPSAPVTSVNTLTGAVVVSGNDIAADHTATNYTATNANVDGHFSGVDTKFGTLGTSAFLDVGTSASNVVQLDGTAKLPAVDGSQLTNLPSAPVTSVNSLTGAVVVSGNDIAADHTAVNYTAANANVDGHFSGIDTKFGTLGTASTAASTDFLQVTNNLSDLNNATTARTNLGLGTAATSASTDFLQVTNNLSDLNNATTARTNLGLGTAATQNVGTTANSVVQLDGTAKLPAVDGSQLTNLPSAPVTSVNALTGAVVVSGNDIAADHTAVNYTAANANVDGHFSGVDTKLGTLLADITGESLNDLSDVSFTAGPGIDNYVLTYDNSTSTWGAEAASGGGGSAPAVTSVSQGTDYTISHNSSVLEDVYIITPSASINVNLPAAATCGSGYKYQIKNMSGSFTLTIDPNSTETVDGSATVDINQQYASLTLITDGSNWFIIQ